MSTKKIRYLIAATFFILSFLLFLDFTICLNRPHCTFHGMEVAGYIFYPTLIFLLGFAGLIFIVLALVYKRRPENFNINSQNVIYRPINPVILLVIGTAFFLVPFFDNFIGLDLFGVKNIFYFGAILFLCFGFIKFFKSLRS